jgi:hypothetical protein
MTKPATAAPTAAPVPTAARLEIFEFSTPLLLSPLVVFAFEVDFLESAKERYNI